MNPQHGNLPLSFSLSGERKRWRPPEPPERQNEKLVVLDLETSGLKWWDNHRPGGVGYFFPESGRIGYLPWGHVDDPCNLDEEAMRRWFNREIRHCHVLNTNTRFDLHMAREWGADLEANGCTVGDISHYAGLLDDSRKRFSQAVLCEDFGIDEGKVETVDGIKLHGAMMMHYPASIVAERAIGDVRQVWKLWEVMEPDLKAQNLMEVKQLEDDLIYPVCEMERNAARIDLTRLNEYLKLCHEEEKRIAWKLHKMTDIKNFNPKSPSHWEKLFIKQCLPSPGRTPSGRIKTARSALEVVDDPCVRMGLQILKMRDLRSKYLDKYSNTATVDGIIRYQLHQMRSDDGGTISGRFSSSAFKLDDETVGINIQQVMHPEKQQDDTRFIIRRLFIPDDGSLFLSSDASQIEYRLFAHFAKSPDLEAAYKDNPRMSFHKKMHEMLSAFKMTYKGLKNYNFAKIYGAGPLKLATMAGILTEQQAEAITIKYGKKYWRAPELKPVYDLERLYERELPDCARLITEATEQAENDGYVTTILGRRTRFPRGHRTHKALNSIIQGSAADIMKRKIVEVYDACKSFFKMRFTVHDEVGGDVSNREDATRVNVVLNRQTTKTRIPILWETGVGPNWADVDGQ